MQIRTVKVSNVSLGATLQDVKEFFSFSGDIEYVEMRRLPSEVVTWSSFYLSSPCYMNINFVVCLCSDTERSQIAFVTFKDSQGAETAVLLSVRLLLFTLYAIMFF